MRLLPDRHERCLYRLVGCALLLSCTNPAGPADRPPANPAAGRMVDIGGYRLHLHCTGKGRPTVVLLSGMGGDSTVWERVQPGVARFTRVCSYDRAGEGRSDPSPAAGSLQQTVNELHRLLLAAKVPKPYVLVGASWGGPIARVYASQHPELVAGMVLVDSTHEDAVLGFQGKMVSPRSLSADEGGAFKADLDLLHASRGGQAQPLGDLPLIVLAAGQSGDPPPGIPAGEWQRLFQVKREQRADQARLSRNSRLVVAERSGHQIQRDDPELVIRAIREVVQAVRTRKGIKTGQ